MNTQTIDIQTPDGICDAYAACPGSDAYPAVLFYMDGFGLRPYLHEMAQKLASHGYYVLVPNMFYRKQRAPIIPDEKFPLKAEDMPEAVKVLMSFLHDYDPELGMRDAGAFLNFLSGQKNVRPGKIATTGYCMGGGLSIRTAARYADKIAAAASFHAGNLASDKPNSPHLLLKDIQAELYIAHADNDKSMPPEQIESLRIALDASQVRYKAEVYASAIHGFTMRDLPACNKSALDRHWENLLALFKRTLS